MERESRSQKNSEWNRCIVNWLCCRQNDPADPPPPGDQNPPAEMKVETVEHPADPVPSGEFCRQNDPADPPPTGDQNPPVDMEVKTLEDRAESSPPGDQNSPADMKVETTLDDTNKFLVDLEKLCEDLKCSSKGSRLSSLWDGYREKASSLMQTVDGVPKEITNEIVGTSANLFLPLLKNALGGAGALHWIAVGCSLVAWALDTVESTGQNRKDCLELLSRTISLLKSVRDVWQATRNEYVAVLEGTVEKAFRCAVICSSMLKRCYLYRFLFAPTIKEAIANLHKDLDWNFQQFQTFMQVRTYVDSRKLYRQVTLPRIDGIVGEDEVRRKIVTCLSKECSKVVAVCLHGMGGIGKSTIGTSIFVEFQGMRSYEGNKKYRCCRVELPLDMNIREVPHFQKQILDMLCWHSTSRFPDAMSGRTLLKEELERIGEPVFLFLDNVLDQLHLSELLPESVCFPEDSRILITTRYGSVRIGIQRLKIMDYELIEVKKLDEHLARELLRMQFEQGKHEPLNIDIVALERQLLGLCDGLPLALKVVGGYIAGSKQGFRDAKVWERAIEAMRAAEPLHGGDVDELYSRLKFSIDDLHPQTRKAFLDIVVAWSSEDNIWEMMECLVSPKYLENLQERALVEKREVPEGFEDYFQSGDLDDSFSEVRVHDVLRAMALQILAADKQEIYITSQDVLHDMSLKHALEKVVSLSGVTVQAKQLQQMPGLRFLQNVKIQGECQAAKRRHLQKLEFRSNNSVPFDVSASESLKMFSWEEVLDPSNLVVPPNVQEWDSIFQQLKKVVILNLLGCGSLKSLPEGVVGLTSLRELDLSRCGNLQSLPEGIAGLTSLWKLYLSSCGSLQSLLEGIAGLTGLQVLSLFECGSLQSLPKGIAGLMSLQWLDLSWCSSLQSLPEGVASLPSLRGLVLSWCDNLQSVPEGVASLTSLRMLDLSECGNLQSVPEGVAGLTDLRVLDLDGCSSLQSLPKGVVSLTALQELYLSGCSSLQSLPEGVTSLTSLQVLDLSKCSSLQPLPEGVTGLTTLRVLDLSGCNNLQPLLEGVAGLTSLRGLDLSRCSSLQSLSEGVEGA